LLSLLLLFLLSLLLLLLLSLLLLLLFLLLPLFLLLFSRCHSERSEESPHGSNLPHISPGFSTSPRPSLPKRKRPPLGWPLILPIPYAAAVAFFVTFFFAVFFVAFFAAGAAFGAGGSAAFTFSIVSNSFPCSVTSRNGNPGATLTT